MNDFHAALAEALFAPEASTQPQVREMARQPGFAVYRNTVMKACIDALEANFPTVALLVGSDWFRAAAARYVPGHLPCDGSLFGYGHADFAAFLQALPSANGLAYLADVGRLDSLWLQAHVAADAPVLAAARLAATAPEALAASVLTPHPAARWAWFEARPAAAIWMRQRAPTPQPAAELAWQGDGILFTRNDEGAGWQPLARAACAFLDACARGDCLGLAAEAALGIDPACDLAALLQQLLLAGTFTHPSGE